MQLALVLSSIFAVLLVWSALPKRQFRRLLLDQRGSEGDGGAGKGGSPFSFGSREEFENSVATIATQMIVPRLKQNKKETLDEVKANFETFSKVLAPKFDEITAAMATRGGKGKKKSDGAGDGAGAGAGDEGDEGVEPANPKFRTMERKLQELEANNKRLEEQRVAAEAKQKNMTVRNRLREVLEAQGVTDPFKLRAASAILISEERRVQYSDSLEDAAVIDTDGAPIELETGVKAWLKTPEGEHYAAPTGAAGSGARARRNGQQVEQAKTMTEADIGLAIVGAFNNSGQ